MRFSIGIGVLTAVSMACQLARGDGGLIYQYDEDEDIIQVVVGGVMQDGLAGGPT